MPELQLLENPLLAALMTTLRDKQTAPEAFRAAMEKIGMILLIEASRSWETAPLEIDTPLASFRGTALLYPVVFAPILRAGLGLLSGMQKLLPEAAVGHIGLYRDETTLRPVNYYLRLPGDLARSRVLLLDPMLATGFSACEAATLLKGKGAERLQLLCVVACDQGIEQFQDVHPDIPIFCAAKDPGLNERGYIVPGLGDAGDRSFGT